MSHCIRFLVLVAALAACSACSDGKPALVPVSGKLLVGGQPAENALLIFHPSATTADTVRPTARVAADGSFKVTTFEPGDGAVAGSYVVTVEWRAAPTNPFDGGGPDKLQGKYNDPQKSTLQVKVENGVSELAPFDLPPAGASS